jgi:hypothetical protein
MARPASRYDPVVSCCEQGNELSAATKDGKFLDDLSDNQRLVLGCTGRSVMPDMPRSTEMAHLRIVRRILPQDSRIGLDVSAILSVSGSENQSDQTIHFGGFCVEQTAVSTCLY